MWNDTKTYLLLHSPFIITMAWLFLSEFSTRGIKLAGVIFVLIHLVTITAYFLHLGDDFGMGTYFMMYLAIPALVLYFKMMRLPREDQRPGIYIPLAILLIPALGIAGLIIFLTTTPMDWR
jgi:hypothetical protein